MPTGKFTDAGLVASGFFDNRDFPAFATRGTAAEIDYFRSDTALGAERAWQTLEAAARQVIQAGITTLSFTVAGGSGLGSKLPADRAFSLGGPQSFPGFSPGEVRADAYWTVEGKLLWRVADVLPIANQTLYGGFGLQAGHVYDRVDAVPDGNLYGISGGIGGRTPVGTLAVGVGRASGGWAGWITLGTPVGSGSILDHPEFR